MPEHSFPSLHHRYTRLLIATAVGVVLTATLGFASARAAGRTVDLSNGQPIEIALVLDAAADFTPGVKNAVAMAVQSMPAIAGHAIQIDNYAVQCTGDGGIL